MSTTINWPARGGGSGSGITKVANAAARLALSPTDGDVVIQLDTDELWEYNSSSWTRANAAPVGTATGDLSGSFPSPSVATVGGAAAADVATSVTDTQGATDLNTASKIVKRDASGNFAAGTITADLTGTASDASNVGGKTAAEVAQSVDDTQAATAANTGSAIVKRDVSGNIAFGQATGDLVGTASGNVAKTGDTMSGELKADGGIDVTSTAGSDVLNIGQNNADVINLGKAGGTVNIYADVINQNVTNTLVTDKNITVNSGGAAASGNDSGIEVEENSAITGYAKVGSSRNSWRLKAPNTAGEAVITPGASGITLDQSSHDPLTIGAGANGLHLTGSQVLEMDVADGTTDGALSHTDWTSFNSKVSADGSIDTHSDVDVTTVSPNAGAVLKNDGTNWTPGIVKEQKNYISNPSALLGTTGWTSSTGSGLSRTTTAANLPRETTTPNAFALTLSADGDYAYTRFMLDDADQNAANLLAKLSAKVADSSVWRLEVWENDASDYSGTYTEIPLVDDDSSGDFYLAATTADFTTFWTPSANAYIEVRLVHAGASSNTIYFSDVLVGPGSVASGAVVGPWTDVAITDLLPGSPGSYTVTKCAWRQVGESVEYFVVAKGDGTGSGTAQFQLHDTSLIPDLNTDDNIDLGAFIDETASTGTNATLTGNWNASTKKFTVSYRNGATTQSLSYTSFTSARTVSFRFSVPISDWAGQGTLYAGNNRVEYVSHDGTSIVYGPDGATMPTTTPSGTSDAYDISAAFSNVQPTDVFEVFCTMGDTDTWSRANEKVEQLRFDGTNFIGIGVYQSGSTIYLIRGKYRTGTSATWGTNTAGSKWKVVKHSAGVPVGFGQATVDNYGLVKQGVAVTDATNSTDVITQLNALLTSLRDAGVITT